jgi:hypothetical protein
LCADYFRIERFTLSRERVNTSTRAHEIRVELEISNSEPDAEAIRQIELSAVSDRANAYGGHGWLTLESGDAVRGVWRGTLYVPQQTPKAEFEVGLYVFSGQGGPGGTHVIDESRLRRAGFDNAFEQIGPGDNGPPVVKSWSFSPSSVDTSQGPVMVTSTMRIVDENGFTSGIYRLQAPNGEPVGIYGPGFLVSGDARDGIYQATFALPRHAAPGTYRVHTLSLGDRFSQDDYSTGELARLGVRPSITQTGPGDSEAPVLRELEVTPTAVNVTQGGRADISAHVVIDDDLTGVAEWLIELRRPQDPYPRSGIGFSQGGFGDGNVPTHVDDTRTEQFPYAPPAPAGVYELTVTLRDPMGNVRVYTSAELAALGFPSAVYNGP